MSATPNDDPGTQGAGGSATRFRASPDAIYNRIGDEGVLIHMRTNRIYDLSRTSARAWELISAGHDRAEIQRILLQEFDVAEEQLSTEIDDLLTSLKNEDLVDVS